MGAVLNTKQGTKVVVSQEDVFEIVTEQCGEEVSSYIKENCESSVDRIFQNPDLVDEILERTDYFSYESSLEDNNATFCEIRDLADDLMEYLDESKKLNRDKIYQYVKNIQEQAILSI